MYKDGTFTVGFFQYSFIKESWTLIHRCFVGYDSNIDGEYVSDTLRLALCDFLKDQRIYRPEYAEIIHSLERILKRKEK